MTAIRGRCIPSLPWMTMHIVLLQSPLLRSTVEQLFWTPTCGQHRLPQCPAPHMSRPHLGELIGGCGKICPHPTPVHCFPRSDQFTMWGTINNVFAKKRGVAKNHENIRAIISQDIHKFAGDIDGAAWRCRRRDKINKYYWRNIFCVLCRRRRGLAPLRGPGSIPDNWTDVKPLCQQFWKVNKHGAFSKKLASSWNTRDQNWPLITFIFTSLTETSETIRFVTTGTFVSRTNLRVPEMTPTTRFHHSRTTIRALSPTNTQRPFVRRDPCVFSVFPRPKQKETRNNSNTLLILQEQYCVSEVFMVIQDEILLFQLCRTVVFRTISSSSFIILDVQSVHTPSQIFFDTRRSEFDNKQRVIFLHKDLNTWCTIHA